MEKNWPRARARPAKEKKVGLAWAHTEKKWWQHCQASTTVDATGRQKKRATKEHPEKRSGERNVDNRIQIQLEEDGGSSTRLSWMETSGQWPMLHWEREGISQSHAWVQSTGIDMTGTDKDFFQQNKKCNNMYVIPCNLRLRSEVGGWRAVS